MIGKSFCQCNLLPAHEGVNLFLACNLCFPVVVGIII